MDRMSSAEIERRLSGRLQAVLSVGRDGRGPVAVAVAMSYLFRDGRFFMVTSPESLHGRLMVKKGRATITVQEEILGHRELEQWYVMAEGPVVFTDEDPLPYVRAIMEKDRGAEFVDEWTARSGPHDYPVAVLTPDKISGYRSHGVL